MFDYLKIFNERKAFQNGVKLETCQGARGRFFDRFISQVYNIAEKVGSLIAGKSAVLVCGGRMGVMEAASKGAKKSNGKAISILPGLNRNVVNDYIDYPIATGIWQGRNLIVVLNSDAIIAIGGEFGTLSEVALALKHGIPVVTIHSWSLEKIYDGKENVHFFPVNKAEEAVIKAFELAQKKRSH
jgi:uncharacterized protein (TIGR00725 family)